MDFRLPHLLKFATLAGIQIIHYNGRDGTIKLIFNVTHFGGISNSDAQSNFSGRIRQQSEDGVGLVHYSWRVHYSHAAAFVNSPL